MEQQPPPRQGDLSWRLSSHPVTLLCFLGFRISSLLVYLFGGLFVKDNLYVLVPSLLPPSLPTTPPFQLPPSPSAPSPTYTPPPAANSVLIFILTILLLAADFYYLKNIAGRRLVGLRWWNEVDPGSGSSTWVFESAPPHVAGGGANRTDSRFFWLALYVQPVLWAGLGVLYVLSPKWLSIVGEWVFFSCGWGGVLGVGREGGREGLESEGRGKGEVALGKGAGKGWEMRFIGVHG
ncbi:Golgi apparatus membrane protein tvp23 [Xylographa parallela]|nr:Golgi apparatus membrane protein tvp23 [Xylographa parallela]